MTTAHGTHDYVEDPRNADVLIYVNGELVPRAQAVVSVFDAGFILGDGVWEGLRVTAGHPAFRGLRSVASAARPAFRDLRPGVYPSSSPAGSITPCMERWCRLRSRLCLPCHWVS